MAVYPQVQLSKRGRYWAITINNVTHLRDSFSDAFHLWHYDALIPH